MKCVKYIKNNSAKSTKKFTGFLFTSAWRRGILKHRFCALRHAFAAQKDGNSKGSGSIKAISAFWGDKTKRRQMLVYAGTVLVAVLFLFFGNRWATQGFTLFSGASMEKPIKARVTQVLDRAEEAYNLGGETGVSSVTVSFQAVILTGWQKGLSVYGQQTLDGIMPVNNKEVEAGDKVLIFPSDPSSATSVWMFWDYVRTDTLLALGAVFAGLLLLFGRGKGVNTLISLAFTVLAVFTVFVPSILTGHNAYFSSVVICMFAIGVTLLIVCGATRKGLVTGVGCVCGVLVSGGLTLLMDRVLGLTGLLDEESAFLLYMDTPSPIDLNSIIFAAIVIGALGAIMDVAMDISSALSELCQHLEKPSFGQMMRSGLQIGRDIMGTMANTLVLAYIGGSLSTVLLLVAYNNSLLGLLNKEMIVVEVLQALVGSLGILCTIPLTSLAAAFFYTRVGKGGQAGQTEFTEGDVLI